MAVAQDCFVKAGMSADQARESRTAGLSRGTLRCHAVHMSAVIGPTEIRFDSGH